VQPPLNGAYCAVHQMWLPQDDLRIWTCPHWRQERHETFAREAYATLKSPKRGHHANDGH
jgi:hypothetical protein